MTSAPDILRQAIAFHQRGYGDQAEALCHEFLRSHADHFDAWHLLAVLRARQGDHERALDYYERAIAIDAGSAHAWFHRGNTLFALGRYDNALASYERALSIDADFIDALNNRGLTLMQLGRYAEALQSYDRALAQKPDDVAVLNNRGNACQALQRFEDAAESLARLVAVAPDHEYARGRLLECSLHAADWKDVRDQGTTVLQGVERGERVIAPFAFLAVSDAAPAQLQCARIFAEDKYPASTPPLGPHERYAHDRIRVAYLSADFREHPLSHLMAGIFERHDRARFETIAVSLGPDDGSAMRSRLVHAFDRFIDVADRSDRDIALMLRSCEIDIAVDLTGYTVGSRPGVLAQRPAPVQVNYLGFPATMGASYIDYIVADRFVIPPERRMHYAENVVYLPDMFQANDSSRASVAVQTPSRRDAGLPPSGFVFCSFNSTSKITPRMFDVWMRLLDSHAGSVLWLLAANDSVEMNLWREADARGVDADRLVFASRRPYPEYMARYALADLFLDTFPFNAGATASDALAMGVPIVTRSGDAFAARMAGSLLTTAGIPELATESLQAYETLASQLAGDPERLREVKAKLMQNRSACRLFDGPRFVHHLEEAYVKMVEVSRRGEPARALDHL